MKASIANVMVILIWVLSAAPAWSYCSLDHLFIGCNEDGLSGTDDDNVLFIDCRAKYHNADGEWHYPLNQSGFDKRKWVLNEPGFDEIHDPDELPADHPLKDPNRSPQGVRGSDYELWVECLSITPGFKVCNLNETILLDEAGDTFNHSAFSAANYGHLHLWYIYTNASPADPAPSGPLWFTFRIYDAKGNYLPSAACSVAFISDPLPGDLVINTYLDLEDLIRFCSFWLNDEGSKKNDYYERADRNRDGQVDFLDFTGLASSWATR